jgi:hypothetical protein
MMKEMTTTDLLRWKEHRLKDSGRNRVIRHIFGNKEGLTTDGWGVLLNDELL